MRVWPNTSGLGASRCAGIIWPGFWQDTTGPLPVSHFQTRFRSSTDTVQNQPRSDVVVLADCVRFWPNGSCPEASRCARTIRPASGQCFPAGPDRMRMGSGMFTGYACCAAVTIPVLSAALQKQEDRLGRRFPMGRTPQPSPPPSPLAPRAKGAHSESCSVYGGSAMALI